MQTFDLAVDSQRQVLRMYFRGFVSAEVLLAAAQQNAASIAQMKPGFTVIADLSDLTEMSIDCVPHITRLMDLFRQASVGRVVRVIPDASKDIGFTLLSYTHYRGKVPFQTVATREAAEHALASSR